MKRDSKYEWRKKDKRKVPKTKVREPVAPLGSAGSVKPVIPTSKP